MLVPPTMRTEEFLPKRLTRVLLPLFIMALSSNVEAELIPIAPPPDIQTLTVTKDVGSGAVVLSWSDGTAPFAVTRSESPNYSAPTNLTYITRSTVASTVSDPVLNDGKTYYYVVADANVSPNVYGIAATAGVGMYDGDTLVIDGVGFDGDCANVTVYFAGGIAATPTSCSPTQLQVQVQELTASGSIVVASASGQSRPIKRMKTVGARSNPARVEQAHINVDGNHNLFVSDQGTSDRIWKIDFGTKLASTCFTFANPVGLPLNEQSRFVFANDTFDMNNGGTVRDLDPATCTSNLWGLSGTAGTDPVDPRALAYDKSGANNGSIFVLDHWGDRIRRKGNGPGLDTMWLTSLGLGGNSAAASRPGGLTFNPSGEFFFTAQSKIEHYSAAKALIQEFTTVDGLNHPAQLEWDESNTLWVANRDAGNVLRIKTNPADRRVLRKADGITSPRAVAFDRDPATTKRLLYVGDQTQVYLFPLYDQTIRLDIKVLRETLIDPVTGVRTSEPAFEARVRTMFEQAKSIFEQCQLDVVLERVDFISDPNNAAGATKTRRACAAPLPEELNVLTADRPLLDRVVNVYFINHWLEEIPLTSPPQYQTSNRIGATYTNDCYPISNTSQGGIVIARYSASLGGGALTEFLHDISLPHEMGHFFLNQYVQPAPATGEDRPPPPMPPQCTGVPDAKFLMYGADCGTNRVLSAPECSDMKTNGDESTLMEPF